jgi:alpha-1,6-mannosyltransferase
MHKAYRALFWLVVMLATIGVAMLVLRTLVSQAHAYTDPSAHLDLSVLLRLPIPVANKIDNGWSILVVVWAMLAILAYCGYRYARAVGAQSPRLIILGLLLVGAALVFFPILLSGDAYAYVIYGRLFGVHGVSPYYLPLPLNANFDQVIDQCLTIYGNPPPGDNYGPLWTLLAGGVSSLIASTSLTFQILVQRVIALGFAILAVAGLSRAVRYRQSWLGGVGRYAFHPLLLFETAVGAHNDIMMVALALWAFALVEEMPFVAGLLIGASIATKYLSLCVLPFLVVKAGRKGWKPALALLAIALAIPVLTFRPFWVGQLTAQSLFWQSANVSMSPSWIVTSVVGLVGHDRVVQIALTVAFLALYGVALWRYARNLDLRNLWLVIAALLWIAPMLNPWYTLWLLPAAASNGYWARFAWWFGALSLLRYVGEVPIYPPVWLLVSVTLVIFVAPILLARFVPRTQF